MKAVRDEGVGRMKAGRGEGMGRMKARRDEGVGGMKAGRGEGVGGMGSSWHSIVQCLPLYKYWKYYQNKEYRPYPRMIILRLRH